MEETAGASTQVLKMLTAADNVADILDHWAECSPGVVALKFPDGQLSYRDLADHSLQVARRLEQAGVGAGSRVGLLDLNTPAYFYLFFALARLGAVLVPVNFRLAPPEIDFIASDAELELLFVGPAFDALVPALKSVPLENVVRLAEPDTLANWFGNWGETPRLANADGQGHVVQMYTSGTTGNPKGVLATHRQYLCFLKAAIGDWAARSPGDRQLVAMPMFHVAGLNMAVIHLAQGAANVVLPAVDPEAILRTLVAERITFTLGAPAVLQMLVQHPLAQELSFPDFRDMVYGASPISEALQARVASTFQCSLVQVYGMTENLGGGTFLGRTDHDPERGLLRSCGKPYSGSELIIADPQGKPVPVGEVGEILMRSDWTMSGYWKRPEETAKTLAGGWLHTGDAAYMNEDGYVFIFDRVKDMIITGGENVYPAEVENVLAGFPGVLQVAVIGVPDETWGEAVKAVVVMKDGVALDPAAITEYGARHLARYKLPKSYDTVQALPLNATGKVLKRELRKSYWAEDGKRVN